MLLKYFVILAILSLCDGYKLLVFFAYPGKSHGILGEAHVRHLLNAGHEVTYITPFPIRNATGNLKQVEVSEILDFVPTNIYNIKNIFRKELDFVDEILWTNTTTLITERVLQTKAIQEFLSDTHQEFDAVIVEWTINDIPAGFSAIFNCPLIWSSPLASNTHTMHLVLEHLNPSYNPSMLSLKYSRTFWDRAMNLWILFKALYFKWTFYETEAKVYKNAFETAAAIRGQKLTPLNEIRYNASLMLSNSNPSVGDAITLPQNFKEVGGYHINNKQSPLPENLKKVLDNSNNGVIYFSMGSMVHPSDLSNDLKQRFIKIFSELNQTVIWKLQQDFDNLPKNIHVLPWAPQQAILAHPNTALFITHGGLLSSLEVVYFGIPIIGIPLFADQPMNIERAIVKGYGERLELNNETPEELKKIIDKMMSNSSYRQRAKEISATYHDRLVGSGEELVFWVEHVVKTRGAPHLRSMGLQMAWYKKLYLDLAAVIFVILSLITYLGTKLCGRKETRGEKKKKA